MTFGFYVRHSTVFIPTFARTDAGFYMHVEPFEVINVNDTKGFVEALKRSISRGNPLVRTPLRHEYKKPEILKYAKVRSWSQFERESSSWSLSETNTIWEFGRNKRRKDRGWEEDPGRVVKLPAGLTIDEVVERIVQAVQLSEAQLTTVTKKNQTRTG